MLLACGPLNLIQQPAPSTQSPGSIETIIFETAAVAQSRTAEAAPTSTTTGTATNTPVATGTTKPSATPTNTVSPTSTFIILLPSATQIVTPTSGVVVLASITPQEEVTPSKTPPPNEHDYSGTLACKSVGKTPSNGTVFSRRQKFTTVWTVKNTGTAAWKKGWIDYRYVGGDKFTDRERFDLDWILDPGETVDIKIEMFAPKKPGNYETTWTVGLNKGGLCKMTLSIVVK